MERHIVLGLAIIIMAVIWCLFFVMCHLEINRRWKRVDRTYDYYSRTTGSRPVLLYGEDDFGAIILQVFPISAGSILTILALSALPASFTPNEMDDPIGIYLLFLTISLIAKILVTLSVRTLFVANKDSIESIRLNRKGFRVAKSILWSDVTEVNVSYRMGSMKIVSGRARIMLATNMENLEPLFQIIRTRVPRTVLSEDATEYISNNYRPTKTAKGKIRISYSRASRAVVLISAITMYTMLIGILLYATGERTIETSIILGVLFFFLPTFLLMEFFLSYYNLSDEGIEKNILRIKKVTIPWSEVKSVKFVDGKYGNSFRVYGSNKKLELVTWLDGMPQFANMVAVMVPPEKWATAKIYLTKLMEKE